LSFKEEKELGNLVKQGRLAVVAIAGNGHESQPEQDEQARLGKDAQDRLVIQNQRLVLHVSKKYRRNDLPLPDLVQAGNLGLMEATCKYDPDRGYRFSTYATWWIRQSIVRSLAYQHEDVSLPSTFYTYVGQVRKAARELRDELDRNPTATEIAAHLGISEITTRNAIKFMRRRYESLDEQVGGRSPRDLERSELVGDTRTPDAARTVDHAILAADLEKALTTAITPREERLLRMRFGLEPFDHPHTLAECGESFEMSRERVRQIVAEAFRKIRFSQQAGNLQQYLIGETSR